MGIHEENATTGEYFVYRELATTDEFEDTFRLRYYIYRGSGLKSLVKENEHQIDFDPYDLRARHFGLFRVHEGSELPVGYLRIVEDEDLSAETGVWDLVSRFPSLGSVTRGRLKHPFPLMCYHPKKGTIRRSYREMTARGDRLVEACRLAIDPCFRSLRLAQHIVESALAVYFFHFGVEHAIWCCDGSHSRFYGLYGLRRFPGTKDSDFLGLGHNSCCLLGSAAGVPPRLALRIARMAEAYGRTGRIACYSGDPLRFTEEITVKRAGVSVGHAAAMAMAG